jgi:hypothetical protein
MTTIFCAAFGSFSLLLLAGISADAKAWRGIVPLHSTRTDVERILGVSKDPCKCIYKTESEVVTIEYTRQTCRQNPDGWNVPPDRVVTINVSAIIPPRFSALNIDSGRYKQTKDLHTTATYYYSEEEGVTYQVSEDGVVGLTIYGPSSSDSKFKCRESSQAERNRFEPLFDQYGDIDFRDEKARLDNFAAQLNHFSESVGYIVVYPEVQGRSAKALNRARRARTYVVHVRRVEANRIMIIQGGRRDVFTTELYILPKSSPPPRAEPASHRR